MPSKKRGPTPPKRSYPSGHAKREAKRKALAAASADEWKARYEEIGAPPPDAVERIAWASRLAALVIYETVVAPEQRPGAERKLVLEGVRTLGMTGVKALYEERLKKLERKVYLRSDEKETPDAGDGLEELNETA